MSTRSANRDASETWTTRRLLRWTGQFLESKGVDSPRLSAELLLAHVLEVPRIRLYTDLDRPASPLERAAYRELVEKAAAHHPIQYLIGRAQFFSLSFEVDPRVLVPRPSTETLVEHVIWQTRHIPGFTAPAIADVGTGSGCIAVALAKNLPEARVTATDVSGEALEVARRNAERHGVAERIDFLEGPLYEPLRGRHFAFVVSNPPYISDDEWAEVPPNVRDHEPSSALRAGPDGLETLRPLVAGAAERLEEPGQLVLEIGASQEKAVLELAEQAGGLSQPRVLPDMEGHPRMLLADHG